MTMVRTVAPTVPAVDIEIARGALGVDDDYLDAQIALWVRGITADLENYVGQLFMEQTWEVRLSGFPADGAAIALPHPAMEIVSVAYVADGSPVTMPADGYKLSVSRYSSKMSLASGAAWPAGGTDVVVEVKCGYGNTPDKTPEAAQLFIIRKLVEQYDPATRLERDTVQSEYLDRLRDSLKAYA